jgi:hypothetical protein
MRRWILIGGAVAVLLVAAGLYWFQPWKLFTSKTVNDAVPTIVAATPPATSGPSASSTANPPATATTAATATLIADGEFITHEHATSGTAQLVRRADGSHQLVLRDLSTSDGPDLRVWLTDQAVVAGQKGWHVFDDGEYVELGRLKGNRGTQVYDVPAGTDVSDFRSVSVWCKRFSVSFGAAELS